MRVKYWFLFLSLFWGSIGYSQVNKPTALFSSRIVLMDGDSITITPNYPSDELCSGETKILNKFKAQILSSGILKSFDIQKHEDELDKILNWDNFDLYNGYHILYKGYLFFDPYYFNLVKVKAVRESVFQILSDFLVDYCTYFPKDFQSKMISDLVEVQNILNLCKQHHYGIIWVDNVWHLTVDDIIDDDKAYSLEGLIVRRIYFDNIPVLELESYTSSLLRRLESLNIQDNPDVLYKATINNELTYCLSIDGPFFFSEKTGKKAIPFDDRVYCHYPIAQKVFYNKGFDGAFYRICNEPLPSWYNDIREIILNSNGDLILKNSSE